MSRFSPMFQNGLTVFFLFVFFFSYSVRAEEVQSVTSVHRPAVLTITEAIQLAMKNSHAIQLATQKIEDAKLQVAENAAQGLPQLSLSANYGRQDPVVKSSGGGVGNLGSNPQFASFLGLSSVNKWSSSLTLSQAIFAGFRIIDGIRLAQINVSLMQESLKQSKQEVAFEVTQSYFQALKVWQMVEVDKETLLQAKAHLEIAQKKRDAGVGIKLDVLRAKNQVIRVQQIVSQHLNTLGKAKAALNMQMGREVDTPIVLNPYAQVQEVEQIETLKATPQVRLELVLKYRADLQQLRLRKEMSELTATIQGRATWPTLTASATYTIQDNQVVDGNNSNTQNMNYGLNLNWPIFDGLGAYSKAQRSMQNARQAQIQIDQLQQQAIFQMNQALLDMEEAQERIIMAKAGIELAQESVRLAEISYREGVGVSLDVLDAHMMLLQSKTELIAAQFDLNVNRAKLYQVVGFDLK